jgi:hypothetical protein
MYHRKQAPGDIVKTPITINPSISHLCEECVFIYRTDWPKLHLDRDLTIRKVSNRKER